MSDQARLVVFCRHCRRFLAFVDRKEQADRLMRIHMETEHVEPRPTQPEATA